MIRNLRWILFGLLVAMGAGCSTPDSRIQKNLDVFNTFPPEVQVMVRAGKVEIGFSADMVRIALGEPHRVYRRKVEKGETEVWSYIDTQFSNERLAIGAQLREIKRCLHGGVS